MVVGDSGDDPAGGEGARGIIGTGGFRSDHADAGTQSLGGDGGATEEAAAADGSDHDVEVGDLCEQFEGGRALTGHHGVVIVRMNESSACFCDEARAGGFAGGDVGFAKRDEAAVAADGRDLGLRCVGRHHDVGGDPRSRAARARAAAWLPEEWVTTPRAASAMVRGEHGVGGSAGLEGADF